MADFDEGESGGAFQDVKGKLYPSIGMKRPGEHVRANFGQTSFVFDIDRMVAVRRARPRHGALTPS